MVLAERSVDQVGPVASGISLPVMLDAEGYEVGERVSRWSGFRARREMCGVERCRPSDLAAPDSTDLAAIPIPAEAGVGQAAPGGGLVVAHGPRVAQVVTPRSPSARFLRARLSGKVNWPELLVGAILGAAVSAVGTVAWRRLRSWRERVRFERLPAVVTAHLLMPPVVRDVPQVSLINDGPGVAKEVSVEVIRAVSPGVMPRIVSKTKPLLNPRPKQGASAGCFDWWPIPLEDGMARVVEVRVRWTDGAGAQERTQVLDASGLG